MFLWDWMQSILQFFGFNKTANILIVGMGNAGKSTLLDMLKTGGAKQFPPSYHPRCEEMTIGGLTIKAYDPGSHWAIQRVLLTSLPDIDGIAYIIDLADRAIFQDSKNELLRILDDPDILPVPIVILGNKTDKATAIGKDELIMTFDLQRHLNQESNFHETGDDVTQRRKCQMFMCSLLKKHGYGDAFRWLAKATNK